MLTPDQAIAIYMAKLNLAPSDPSNIGSTLRGLSLCVSKQFGVSPRAIRDIWNRRSWGHTTFDLWDQEKKSVTARESFSSQVLV